MSGDVLLRIDGEVESPRELTFSDLLAIESSFQVHDVTRYGARRPGDAVTLEGLLQLAGIKSTATYLGLHSLSDNFHASIPLSSVRERGLLIYRIGEQPLDAAAGGPLRFFIPEHAACQQAEADACANVKFVEHLELTASKGYDNRRQDDEEQERLHQGQ